ncbi:MAG: pilus assembly protein PilM [Nitrospiria bacterium]
MTWWKKKTVYSPIGIDIGDRSVKMVQLKKTDAGVSLHAVSKKEVSEKDVREPDRLIKVLKTVKRKSPFVGCIAVSRMPHAQTTILPIQLPKTAINGEAKEGNSFENQLVKEAERYLTYPVEEAVIDYIPMHRDVSETRKVLLTATKRTDVVAHLRVLSGAGLQSEAIDVGPNAIRRLFRSVCKIENRVLLINVGRRKSFFTILWDGDVIIDRPVAWGEDRLIEGLSKALEIDLEASRRMLFTYGINLQKGATLFPQEETALLSDDAIASKIAQITFNILESFIAEVEKVLVFCASEKHGTMIDQTYLMGGSTFLLGGGLFVKKLPVFLTQRLGINVKIVDPLNVFHADFHKTYNPSLFDVSIGLALKGFA